MNTLEKIKYLRKTNGLTQQEVAKAIGTSGPNYSRYESGEWNFTVEHIKKLASFYNVSISYLLNDEIKDNILISKEDFKKLIEASNVIMKIERSINKNE